MKRVFFGASGLEVPQEVLYRRQMIDSPLVTSLYDKKSGCWEEKAPINSTTTLWRTEERGDALPNSKQQGPKERHLECAYLPLHVSSAQLCVSANRSLSFSFLSFFFFLKDVQPRCFILRSVLPTRARFLVDLTYFFSSFFSFFFFFFSLRFRADQDLTRNLQLVRICARGDRRRAWAVFGPPRRSSVD